jgi:hypothetical protein
MLSPVDGIPPPTGRWIFGQAFDIRRVLPSRELGTLAETLSAPALDE